MFNTYYQDELQYLREVGPEFAQTYPEIARFLSDRAADPDVERLLEGVAFLCGRIRQKLDDELPEFTANLMALLWPHYLRPIPSMSILEMRPNLEAMQAPLHVPAGAQFGSIPVDGTLCRYRSCWPTILRPWALTDARLETEAARPVRLVMRLQTSPKAKMEDMELRAVRLYLAGDPRVTFALYLLLAQHVESLTVSDGSDRHDRPEVRLGPEAVAPAGLGRPEGVLPYPAHSFAGYRLLQEYLTFKERFLFVDVKGLDRAVGPLNLGQTLEMIVTFNHRLESLPLVTRENLRLHCVPIINLFEQPAEPIRLRHDRTEYLLLPSAAGVADRRHVEVYSVDRVLGGRGPQAGTDLREYMPFYSFEHVTDGRNGAYYQMHRRPNVLGGDPRLGTDVYISFCQGAAGEGPAEEAISTELTCTNRHLPAALRAGDINQRTDTSPPGVEFRNLLKPTETICPPMGKALHWRLISHMALNYVSLTDAGRFQELLRVYDFLAEYDTQQALAQRRMIEGVRRMSSRFGERMVRGAPLRGTQVELELDEDHFAGMGHAYLFGRILDRFLGLYTTLNAFTQLTLRLSKSGSLYVFPPRSGEQPTPADARQEGGHD